MILVHKEHRDPLTGDRIGRSERMSLFIQSAMRRWTFVALYCTTFLYWYAQPRVFGDTHSYLKLQFALSLAALVLESIVGIGMFGWARRDSVILRRIHVLEREAVVKAENDHVLLHAIHEQTTVLTELLQEVRYGHGLGNGKHATDTR